MRVNDLGDVIATRRLLLQGTPEKEIVVSLGKPQPSPDCDAEWFCPYQIAGIDDDRVYAICGIDGLQAIELATKIIGVKLSLINKQNDGKLRWKDGSDGNLGFPVPES